MIPTSSTMPPTPVIESVGQGNDVVFASVNFGLAANVETLVLQGGADLQGFGNGLANSLFGNTGNNLLDGGAGADAMSGGAGNDTYFVDNAGDAVIESAGQGNDAVFASINYGLTANVETLGAPGRSRPAGLRQWSGQLAVRQYRQQSPRRRRRRGRHERRARQRHLLRR